MKSKTALKNVTTAILLQVANVVSGFVIPKIILSCFGSEVNGLVSSLNQFLNFTSIFEGGISAVILANMYKPVLKKDKKKLGAVVNASEKIFRKIAGVVLGFTIVLAVFYPLIVKTDFDYMFVSSLAMILGVKLFIQYGFSFTYRTLIKADKKVYIVSGVQILCYILDVVLAIISVKIFPSVHFLKFVSAVVYLLQPILFSQYVKKHFDFKKEIEPDKKVLAQRWDGFGINIASFIHSNTDLVLLSVCTNLYQVSIYAVYSLVTNGLRKVIAALSEGLSPSLGVAYANGDEKHLKRIFTQYEFLMTFMSFFLFTMGGLLITPFVQAYTAGITDADYFQPIFGWLIIIAEFIYCLREPYANMASAANHFKKISKFSYIEAGINIVVSLILIWNFGIYGVAIGTILAMLYRTVVQIWYLKKNILNYSILERIKLFTIFAIFSGVAIFVCEKLFSISEVNYLNWIVLTVKDFAVVAICYGIMCLIFFRKNIRELLNRRK